MLLELLSDAQTLPYYSAYMARILDLNELGRNVVNIEIAGCEVEHYLLKFLKITQYCILQPA